MRARNWFLGFAAGTAAVVAVIGSGCGGSQNDSTPTPDASVDSAPDTATADVTPDVPDVQDAGMVCTVDADLNTFTVDAGAACISCFKQHCSQVISQCNMDCDCKAAFVDFFNCTGMGGSLISCAQSTLAGIDPTYQQELQGCAPPCLGVCVPPRDGGPDGARDGATDGGSPEASTDGGPSDAMSEATTD
jgi:hypothetical protein